MATTKNKFREKPEAETVNELNTVEKNNIEEVISNTKNKSKASKNPSLNNSESKKTIEKNSSHEKLGWAKIVDVYKLEQTQKLIGLFLILVGTSILISCVSYLFTWQLDQDKLFSNLSTLFSEETKVYNWLGKFGAIESHFLIYKWFGVSSFILVPVLFIFGIQKLLGRQFNKPSLFNAKWLFIMVWSSLALSFMIRDKLYFLGGGYGYILNQQLLNYIGNIGTLVFLVFTMLAFLVLSINLSFNIQKNVLPNLNEEDYIDEEINEPIINPHASTVFNQEKKQTNNELEFIYEVINKNLEDNALAPNDSDDINAAQKIDPENLEFEIINSNSDETINELDFVKEEPKENSITLDDEIKAAMLVEEFGQYDPTLDLGHYQFPSFELLIDYGTGNGKVNNEELVANKDKIVKTLKNYGIDIERISATVGPTVTLYEIVPAPGVRISKIKNLEDDIALSLAALGIRIIAPIPGRGTIGIEVPNQTPEMVPMRNIITSEKFQNTTHDLPIALGKTINNEIFIADLAKMPHLLLAGATGQGKSVGLNAILVSLLYKKHPAQIKFVLIDPKKVELTLFNKIERHFLAKLPNSEEAIITDNTKVIHTLNSLCIEMDNRYALLQDAQVRNIKEYNVKFINRKLNPNEGHKYLPYIVLVVDEFADLIMTAGKEVETPIARLAQLARAIGIHLIIATQRPSVNIITGTIKANFPARIAFRVTSKIDSRTILDVGGAEQLIGRGDMLLSTGNDLIRIQCAFVDTPEAEKITEFIGSQRAYPSAFLLPEYVGEDGESGKDEIDLSERDKMFDEAAKLVVQFQQGSASFLQRKLKLGYNRAGRIVDQLEAAGIIGQFEGSKAREVKCKDFAQLDEIMKSIKN
ncbi:MAG: DNA translocase FtsK 4TM domain-containing protein [Bacteroidota bacterium]